MATLKKETIGQKIRALRIRARLTRDQVVSILCLPIGEYIDIEESRGKVTESVITDIVNLYGCDRKSLEDARPNHLTILKVADEKTED